jgi:hypothetical protein
MINDDVLPNPDRVLIRDVRERKLCGLGVPRLFWNPQLSKLKFKTVKLGAKQLSPTGQLQWVEWLLKEPAWTPPLVVVTSGPTDNGAQLLAYYLALTQCLPEVHANADAKTVARKRKARNLAVVNAAIGVPAGPKPHPHLLVIHNITASATDARIEVVRDLLYWYPYSFRIVVLAGESDPYKWSVQRLRRYPTVVFNVQDVEAAV